MENVSATSTLELSSNHEEADTRIVLHCLHAADTTASDVDLVVRSPDTDVFILLVHYSARIHNRLFMDSGCGRLTDACWIYTCVQTSWVEMSAEHCQHCMPSLNVTAQVHSSATETHSGDLD